MRFRNKPMKVFLKAIAGGVRRRSLLAAVRCRDVGGHLRLHTAPGGAGRGRGRAGLNVRLHSVEQTGAAQRLVGVPCPGSWGPVSGRHQAQPTPRHSSGRADQHSGRAAIPRPTEQRAGAVHSGSTDISCYGTNRKRRKPYKLNATQFTSLGL